jgi:hypothetical protein
MDKKEAIISRKGVDEKTIISKAKFIFVSNQPIPPEYPMFRRRVQHIYVDHSTFDCSGCRVDYTRDNQLGLFDIDGEQIMVALEEAANNFKLDINDENTNLDGPRVSRFIHIGLDNVMSDDEIERFFEAMRCLFLFNKLYLFYILCL